MINSRYNAQFKELKTLLEPKGARKAGRVLISGRKIVPELMDRAVMAVTEEGVWPESLPRPKKVLELHRSLFKDLDIFGTHYPLLALALPEMPQWTSQAPSGFELVLSLQDPANLGATLRSAEAFGVRRAILLKECAYPFHPKAVRASSGSCFRVELCEGPRLQDFAAEGLFALDMSGTRLDQWNWPENVRLLIGEEGQGLPAGLAAERLSIPMQAGMDSLNAAIAASIAMFSYQSQWPR